MEPSFNIRIKDWERLPIEIRQALLLHIPQVWMVWKPWIPWPKWVSRLWGRWIPRNVSMGRG